MILLILKPRISSLSLAEVTVPSPSTFPSSFMNPGSFTCLVLSSHPCSSRLAMTLYSCQGSNATGRLIMTLQSLHLTQLIGLQVPKLSKGFPLVSSAGAGSSLLVVLELLASYTIGVTTLIAPSAMLLMRKCLMYYTVLIVRVSHTSYV